MARARSLEERLAKVRRLRGMAPSPAVLAELRAALDDPLNVVAAEAAAFVGSAQLMDLAPTLVAAFDHFLLNPLKSDKQCRAKIAIAEALNQLEFTEEDVFWRGARYMQLEPIWGSHQDTAAPLRVTCTFALVRLRAHGAMPLVVDLLNDPEKIARVGAAQALAYAESEAAALLLRLKARIGDREPDVIAECFAGLVKMALAEGVAFVSEFLDSDDVGVQEAAILALGDSRRPEAFEILKTFWDRQVDVQVQETVLMALALLRLPAAVDFLLALVSEGRRSVAEAAVSALALQRHDARVRERTAAAVAASGQNALQAYFAERFRVND
jgi:HEAT repeat protein